MLRAAPWVVLSLIACGGSEPAPGLDGGGHDGAAERPDGAASDGGRPGDDGGPVSTEDGATGPCAVGARACRDLDSERVCEDAGSGPAWVDAACADFEYCLDDRCVPACLDECVLGETRTRGGARETCRLVGADGGARTPSDGAHDRARDHLAWIRRHHLANGYVADAVFADTTYRDVTAYAGTVDAAEWTGAYLAAESFRALATRSPDALRNVDAIIERVHELFEITGVPGSMARIWAPLDGDPRLAALYDEGDWSHFPTTYQGGRAFYHAWTSRDMYAGVAMGLGVAYEATTSEAHRERIRDVIVTLATELATLRRAVPVRIRYHAFGSWQQTDLTFDMQHVVLVPNEMIDGRVFIQVGTDASPSNYDASELRGVREFLPNMTTVLGQTPVVGRLLPAIPRPGSALMLASFMELALHVTRGVPGREAQREMIRAHYEAARPEWLGIMRQYAYHNESECWSQYFGMTIAHHPLFTLLRITEDAAFRDELLRNVLGARMRSHVTGHANAYFDFIAATQGEGLIPRAELDASVAQLLGFVAPPKAALPIDNRGRYPENAECPGQSTSPVAVSDRVRRDFIWQHHPFQLVAIDVNPRHVYPGADYLLAYWMGRHYELLADDAPNTCARWAAD